MVVFYEFSSSYTVLFLKNYIIFPSTAFHLSDALYYRHNLPVSDIKSINPIHKAVLHIDQSNSPLSFPLSFHYFLANLTLDKNDDSTLKIFFTVLKELIFRFENQLDIS